MPRVTAIPATLTRFTSVPIEKKVNRKVAGYARVSTDHEEQETSYSAQIDYYTRFIKEHEDWDFVDVYTDEGISGTSTAKRTGFMKMINDALDGKIDLIITKSISRFARNTVDSLTMIRKLKAKGIEVYFEKENIWTLDSKSEVIITIMSSIAQEESRSISENVTWGKRKSFSDGKVYIQTNGMLGWKKTETGEIVIDEAEAPTVRFIFSSFATGKSLTWIANELTTNGIKTAKGKDKWSPSQVRSILRNEKYTGNALLQKSYSIDFLSKKRRVNNGEVPQFYVEDSHPAIISKDLFDIVQDMMKKESEGDSRRAYKGNIFSGRIICADCGSAFAPKVWHSKDKYKRTIWQCCDKFKGDKCTTPHLMEEEIKSVVVKAVNAILPGRSLIIRTIETTADKVFATTALETKRSELEIELNGISTMVENLIKNNATELQDQSAYLLQYGKLTEKFTDKKREIENIDVAIAEKIATRAKVRKYAEELKKQPEVVTEFSDELFTTLIDRITVKTKAAIVVEFKDGSSRDVSLEF